MAPEPTKSRLTRLLVDLIVLGHALMAGLWFWVMPSGFPVNHARFWVNSVYPWAIIGLALFAWCVMRGRRVSVIVAIAALWLAGAVSARITFPLTFRFLWIFPLFGGLAFAALCVGMWKIGALKGRAAAILFALVGALLGAAFPLTQKADRPGTRPLGTEIPPFNLKDQAVPTKVDLGKHAEFYTGHGVLSIWSGDYDLDVLPLLTFDSRSPDGCWTLLAPGFGTRGPIRRPTAMESDHGSLRLSYPGEFFATLEVKADEEGRRFELISQSQLSQPVWSHLNSFAELYFRGSRDTSIIFSPCPNTPIEVVESDYPVGRPTRFAYLDEKGIFRVAEARSAEKGPFRELASGPLQKDAPITLTLISGSAPRFRVTLQDWASQAGTQLSPTAGWGVPVNAIEFFKRSSSTQISITLAGTSVGRGFDSVGHAAGTYVNRMTIEVLPEQTAR